MSVESFQNNEADAAQDEGSTASPELEENGTPGEQDSEPRTFTQDEVDAAIGKRLAKAKRLWERDQAAQANATQRPVNPPQPNQYPSTEKYQEALVDYRADQKIAQRDAEKQSIDVFASYNNRTEKAMEKYSDFEQIAHRHPKDGGPPITEDMAKVIFSSEIGPEIAYHLGKNPDESWRIFQLSPLEQAKEIGKIEAKLTATPPAVKPSSAPNPITPVGSRSSTPKVSTSDSRSDKAMTTSEWIDARNREELKRIQNR